MFKTASTRRRMEAWRPRRKANVGDIKLITRTIQAGAEEGALSLIIVVDAVALLGEWRGKK